MSSGRETSGRRWPQAHRASVRLPSLALHQNAMRVNEQDRQLHSAPTSTKCQDRHLQPVSVASEVELLPLHLVWMRFLPLQLVRPDGRVWSGRWRWPGLWRRNLAARSWWWSSSGTHDIVANSGRAGTNNVVTPSASFIAASSYSRRQSVAFLTPRMITPHPFRVPRSTGRKTNGYG